MKQLAVLLALYAAACGSKSPPSTTTPPPSGADGTGGAPAGGPCVKTGCSGTICAEADSDVMTTCEMRPEYACYQSATCERQPDGACGWTQTDALTACLANPPPQP